MATESARWAVYGALIGVIFFGILIGWTFLSAPQYTAEQKVEINHNFAINCTKCLEKENVPCTAEQLEYSHWGAICGVNYTPKNCTPLCKKI
jgi:hypothetical protein